MGEHAAEDNLVLLKAIEVPITSKNIIYKTTKEEKTFAEKFLDGVAMALRAGAALLDLEFVQFHPTALAIEGAPRFLISEAVRGEGALLRNRSGERFTDELTSRDQVARAIARENRAGRGPVSLDLSHLDPERVKTRFPRIHATCLRYGVDITRDRVPVTPAGHYFMGGVATDLDGRTSLPGL